MVIDFVFGLSEFEGVDGVNIIFVEIDKEIENVKIIIMGDNFDYEEIVRIIEEFGSVVYSIDMVVVGKRIIEEEEIL